MIDYLINKAEVYDLFTGIMLYVKRGIYYYLKLDFLFQIKNNMNF